MYQVEFAERIVSGPGTKSYSRLGVKVQYGHECSIAFLVPRGAFSPPPDVGSAVVLFEPREPKIAAKSMDMFYDVTNTLFLHRRKKAKKNIRTARETLVPNTSPEDLDRVLEEWGHGDDRIESIPVDSIVSLSNMLVELGSKV